MSENRGSNENNRGYQPSPQHTQYGYQPSQGGTPNIQQGYQPSTTQTPNAPTPPRGSNAEDG